MNPKFLHAISPTPASTMSAAEISTKPLNTTSSPYTVDDTPKRLPKDQGTVILKNDIGVMMLKNKDMGDGNAEKLCFTFLASGSCLRGGQLPFSTWSREQFMKGVCFDFLIKGKCERVPECQFNHKLVEEGESNLNRSSRSHNASTNRPTGVVISGQSLKQDNQTKYMYDDLPAVIASYICCDS